MAERKRVRDAAGDAAADETFLRDALLDAMSEGNYEEMERSRYCLVFVYFVKVVSTFLCFHDCEYWILCPHLWNERRQLRGNGEE
jgi:hypothetical protein